jgi:hypothetical protein
MWSSSMEISRFDGARQLLQRGGRGLERRRDRLAIGRQDVGPQLRIAPGDAGEAGEAGAGHLGGTPRRLRQRAGKGEGEQVRNVTRPGHFGVVALGVAAHHPGAERAPEGNHALDGVRVPLGGDDAGSPLEEVGPRKAHAPFVAAGHRVGAHVVHARRHHARQAGADGGLHAADVGHDRAFGEPRPQPVEHGGHRMHGRREHHEVGPARDVFEREDLVHRPAAERLGLGLRLARRPCDRPRDAARARGESHRAPQQPQPHHRDPREERRHAVPSMRRRNAFTSRSFSSGSPMLMRT